MIDDRDIPPDLSGWYSELAEVWLRFAQSCRLRASESLDWKDANRAQQYMELAHKASLRCGRYARLAEDHKVLVEYQQDMVAIEGLTTEDLETAIHQMHGLTKPQDEVMEKS